MLVLVIFEAMIYLGLVSVFMLTRAAAGVAWPPPDQPWFPLQETAISSAALLISGALVFLAARARQQRAARTGPLLLAGIVLGSLFVFFQGIAWVTLIRQGLSLTSSQHGSFFYLIVAMHAANALGVLVFLGVAWRRLKPLRVDPRPRGSAFSAACILWYFVVGVWPGLYLCLYL
jgi:cytochrome c oxidase subunit 3